MICYFCRGFRVHDHVEGCGRVSGMRNERSVILAEGSGSGFRVRVAAEYGGYGLMVSVPV